jgi:hypothetical protein
MAKQEDIVERLRRVIGTIVDNGYEEGAEVCEDAAEEIERLRAELAYQLWQRGIGPKPPVGKEWGSDEAKYVAPPDLKRYW